MSLGIVITDDIIGLPEASLLQHPFTVFLSGIIVITDGVVGLPEASLFESLMGQLRHSTISCSFIQIGEDFKHNAGLGHVPYSDMLSYMATSTFGTLFTRLPQLVSVATPPKSNYYQDL